VENLERKSEMQNPFSVEEIQRIVEASEDLCAWTIAWGDIVVDVARDEGEEEYNKGKHLCVVEVAHGKTELGQESFVEEDQGSAEAIAQEIHATISEFLKSAPEAFKVVDDDDETED
jgi:hypothetical protein